MSIRLRFKDHEEFQRAAAHMAVAGGLAGLAAHVAALAWPSLGNAAGTVGIATVLTAAGYAAADPSKRTAPRHLVMVGALGATMALGPLVFHGALAWACILVPFAIMLARGTHGVRLAVALAAGVGAAFAVRLVYTRIFGATELATVPPILLAPLAGAAAGFVAVIGRIARHVDVVQDRVADAHARLAGRLSGEMRDLVARANAVWARVTTSLAADDPVRRAIADAVLRLYDVAQRWSDVELDGGRPSASALVDRMAQLDGKIAASSDDVVRSQYGQARAALAEQLRFVEGIATSRERVLARMHHYLAAMERLRLAVVSHRSADASQKSGEVQPILDDLRELGSEIELGSEALGEVEADAERESRPIAQA